MEETSGETKLRGLTPLKARTVKRGEMGLELMSETERQTSFEETFPRSAEVKPLGSCGMADKLIAGQRTKSPMFGENLMEVLVEKENMQAALKRVKKNGGAAGVDGMTTEELPKYLKGNWLGIKEQLLQGSYHPNPVRRVEIPKADGSKRKLGIPCVVDRLARNFVDGGGVIYLLDTNHIKFLKF